MRFAVKPDSEAAIGCVHGAVAEALDLIEQLKTIRTLTYEDDFGVSHIAPGIADTPERARACGLIAAAEGISLAFSDEEASVFRVGDLDWAATNLQRVGNDVSAAGDHQVELPHDDSVSHIELAIMREISRRNTVVIEPIDQNEHPKLPGTESLNEQQRAAVNSPATQDLLVNAGAGSGKTHMLAMRIARLVAEHAMTADRCVVLTFSQAARNQIRDRLNFLALSEYPTLAGIDVRTIHSMGRRVLQLAAAAGRTRVRPGFHVLTEGRRQLADGKSVAAPSLFIEQYDRLFDGINDGRSERSRLSLYPSAIDSLRNGHPQLGVIASPDQLPATGDIVVLNPRSGDLTELDVMTLATVWRRYELLMASHNAIDFAGMVTEALGAVRAHPNLATVAAAPYEHIFVDEFQDTSRAQNDLLFELAAQGAILSCVGDGDQTIFSFAGADPRSLTDFAQRLLDRTGRRAIVLPLEYNYRSVPEIVDAAESVIARNIARLSKRMRPVREEIEGGQAIIVMEGPIRYAAPGLALHVRGLLDHGIEAADIGVLFRKEGFRSPQESAVIQHLEKLAVPVTTEAADASAVRVLSIHQAKGSEFKHVMCLYLGPGHFPDDRGDGEEERRLLYVAVTRARDSVVLAGETGATPDLFGEFVNSRPGVNRISVRSLSDVLAAGAIDDDLLSLTDMDTLDASILDWDDPLPELP